VRVLQIVAWWRKRCILFCHCRLLSFAAESRKDLAFNLY
jgi:hypothetical protein